MKRVVILMTLMAAILGTSSFKTPEVIFTGKYDINAETHSMVLLIIQTGNTVVGTYDVPHGGGNLGYLTGMVNGHRIDFELYEVFYGTSTKSVTGSGYLELSHDHRSLSGKVNCIYDGESYGTTWSGPRLD